MHTTSNPHADQPTLTAGTPADQAKAILILLHGRGGDAHGMLELFNTLQVDGLTAIAPQAANHTWYPQSFLAPLDANQPYLDSALQRITSILNNLTSSGMPSHRIALLGFSQGACLTCEFIARNPRKYGAVMALTGGLIGPPGGLSTYNGALENTPVFLGTSDPDSHVPISRVEETRDILTKIGGQVELRRYPGMPHTINDDEIDACRKLLHALVNADS